MSFRNFLDKLEKSGNLVKVRREIDPNLEITRILKESKKTILFENVKESEYRVVGNVCSSRVNFATALGIEENGLLKRISDAVKNPKEPEVVEKGCCQEVVEEKIDLSRIPILTHNSGELGPYITAGVFIARDKEYGVNMSFHRTSPVSGNKLVARICQRDLYRYIERAGGELDVAICIGLPPSVLLASGLSMGIDVDEMSIANSLHPLNVVRCKTSDLYVPADSEIVLEGRVTNERVDEGPFIDITGTYDIVRREPVIEINSITHRRNPIYQALIPSSTEHKLLMGMPREPVIYKEVNKVCVCRDVLLTTGGCSWLHGLVQIKKNEADDGRKAIDAAFRGHRSLKHLVVVDEDIDIHNPEEVEWALATRFQAEKDMVVLREKGSSLDPSAEEDRTTSKVGIDATIPGDKERNKFMKAGLGE